MMEITKPEQVKKTVSIPVFRLERELYRNSLLVQKGECHSLTRWARRFLINMLVKDVKLEAPGATLNTPFVRFTCLPIKSWEGYMREWSDGIVNLSKPPNDALLLPLVGRFNFMVMAMIGKSDQPESPDDYNLINPGDPPISALRKQDILEDGVSYSCELQTNFQVTDTYEVKETGLLGSFCFYESDTAPCRYGNFLVSRDLVTPPLPVTPGDIVIVVYRLVVG